MTQPSQTASDLDADHGRVLSRLVDINAQISELAGEAESLKAELRGLRPGDYLVNGRPALRIIPTRRFDAASAASLLSPEQREAALVVSFDAAKVRQHLTAVEIDEFMVEAGKPKVTVL